MQNAWKTMENPWKPLKTNGKLMEKPIEILRDTYYATSRGC